MAHEFARRVTIIVKGTYLQNDATHPLVYGDVEIENVKRQRLKGEPLKEGVLCEPVMVGFCGTDNELMNMGSKGLLGPKFPAGKNRLINGHSDTIVIADGNFPAASIAEDKYLIRMDGHGVPEILEAILQVFPLDQYVDKSVTLMERFKFYDEARKAYAVIATSETSQYANVILQKGCVL